MTKMEQIKPLLIMREEFNKINMDGKIIIGEGEMDEAPMLVYR